MPDLIGPVVGGFAVVQSVPREIEVTPAGGRAFAGTATHGEIRLEHRIGPVDPRPGRLLVSAPPPMGRCWVDPAGNLALSNTAPDGGGEQLLRTEVDGRWYTLTHEAASTAAYYQWLWQRTVFSYAVASRGAGLVAHATALRFADGRALLCPGISGTGKSTLARLVAEHAPGQAAVLCDDRVFVRRDARGASVWGTPWHSAAGTMDASGGSLASIVLLARGPGATLRRLEAAEATRLLLRTLALPFWSDTHMTAALAFLSDLLDHTPVHELRYTPGREAVALLVGELGGGYASRTAAGGAR